LSLPRLFDFLLLGLPGLLKPITLSLLLCAEFLSPPLLLSDCLLLLLPQLLKLVLLACGFGPPFLRQAVESSLSFL